VRDTWVASGHDRPDAEVVRKRSADEAEGYGGRLGLAKVNEQREGSRRRVGPMRLASFATGTGALPATAVRFIPTRRARAARALLR